jgi:hypothetical protein
VDNFRYVHSAGSKRIWFLIKTESSVSKSRKKEIRSCVCLDSVTPSFDGEQRHRLGGVGACRSRATQEVDTNVQGKRERLESF